MTEHEHEGAGKTRANRMCAWCQHPIVEQAHQMRLTGALIRHHCDRCTVCGGNTLPLTSRDAARPKRFGWVDQNGRDHEAD